VLTAESLRRTEKVFTQCRAGLAKARRWGRRLWLLCLENHLPVGAFALPVQVVRQNETLGINRALSRSPAIVVKTWFN